MLRITKQTDYAIVLLTELGAGAADCRLTAKDLSARTRISPPMVAKILKELARHDLLTSHRGVAGGYGLARRPDDISLVEIIEALEGPLAMTECSEGVGDCRLESTCSTRVNWLRINVAIHEALSGITLAEMVQPGCGELQPIERRFS